MARKILFTTEPVLKDESGYLSNDDIEALRCMVVDDAFEDLKDRFSKTSCDHILVFVRLDLPDGSVNGYGVLSAGDTLAKVLDVWGRDDDVRTLYIKDDELKADGVSRDGTNTYWLREFTGNEDELEDFEFRFYEKNFNFEDENIKKEINRLTKSLAPKVA